MFWCCELWNLAGFFLFFFKSIHSLNCVSSLLPSLTGDESTCLRFLHPSEDQKVAGVALTPTREAHPEGSHSLSTTHPFLPFNTSPTSDDMGVISAPVTSAHSYWFLVFFPLLVYVESVVCLCSASVGGFCPFVWKTHQTVARGTHDAWTAAERLVFALWGCHWLCSLFFIFSRFMENIIRQKKDGRHHARVSAALLEKWIIFWKEICCFISKTKHELVWNYSAQFRWSKQLSATFHLSTDSFSLLLGGKSEGPFMHRCSAF